jgi:hypothetical protein
MEIGETGGGRHTVFSVRAAGDSNHSKYGFFRNLMAFAACEM